MIKYCDTEKIYLFDKPRWTLMDGMIMFVAFGIVPLVIISCMSSPEMMRVLYRHVEPQTFQMIRNAVEAMRELY